VKGDTGVRVGDGDTEEAELLGTLLFGGEGRLLVIEPGEAVLDWKVIVILAGVGTIILFCSLAYFAERSYVCDSRLVVAVGTEKNESPDTERPSITKSTPQLSTLNSVLKIIRITSVIFSPGVRIDTVKLENVKVIGIAPSESVNWTTFVFPR
jgi:hypothetical protein